jgi:hypothetical protein
MRIDSVEAVPPGSGPMRVLIAVPAGAPRNGYRTADYLAQMFGPQLLNVRGLEGPEPAVRVGLARVGLQDLTSEISTHRRLRDHSFFAAPARHDWRRTSAVFVEGTLEIEPIPGTENEREIELPLLRLHWPRRAGCIAKYGIGLESGESGSFSYSIAGVGIGAGIEVSATATNIYTADSRCIEVVSRTRVTTALVVVRVNGMEVDQRIEARAIAPDLDVVDPRPLAAEADRCEQSYDAARTLPNSKTTDLLGSTDPAVEENLAFARKTTGSLDLDVELPGKPLMTLKLGLERTTNATTTIETSLVAGARYTSYEPAYGESIERCWTTN